MGLDVEGDNSQEEEAQGWAAAEGPGETQEQAQGWREEVRLRVLGALQDKGSCLVTLWQPGQAHFLYGLGSGMGVCVKGCPLQPHCHPPTQARWHRALLFSALKEFPDQLKRQLETWRGCLWAELLGFWGSGELEGAQEGGRRSPGRL